MSDKVWKILNWIFEPLCLLICVFCVLYTMIELAVRSKYTLIFFVIAFISARVYSSWKH